MSNFVDSTKKIIVIPTAKPIENKMYLAKTMTIGVLISTIIFIIFTSTAFSFYQMITMKKVTFYRIFGQVFRSTLAQPFPSQTSLRLTSIYYVISMLFGFMITTWFSAAVT